MTSTGSPAARTASTSALQPYDDRAGLHMRDDQRVDRVLRQGVARALLGDRDALRGGGREIEHTGVDQPVMDDDVGRLQCLHRADREQPGIARPRTDEDDAPAGGRVEETGHGRKMGAKEDQRKAAMLGGRVGEVWRRLNAMRAPCRSRGPRAR